MKWISFILPVLILFACNGGQITPKEIEFVESAIKKEEPIEYEIEVLKDSSQVAEVSERIEQLQRDLWVDLVEEEHFAKRYIQGERKFKDEVLSGLYTSDDEKETIFWYLNDHDGEGFHLTDPKIIAAVYANLKIVDHELDAVSVILHHELPGYVKELEEHFLSGESHHEGALFYHLSEIDGSIDCLDYFLKKLENGEKYTNSEFSSMIQGLYNFRLFGSPSIQKRAEEIALYIYNNDLVKEENYEELDERFVENNPAYYLLDFFFEFGGKIALPLAERFVNFKGTAPIALKYLIRTTGEKYRRNLVELMKYEDTYGDGLALVSDYYDMTHDDRIVHSAITSFEVLYGNFYVDESWMVDQLIVEVNEIYTDSAREEIKNYFKMDEFRKYFFQRMEINKYSRQDIFNELYKRELTDERVIDNFNHKVEEDVFRTTILFRVFKDAGIYFWYYREDYSVEKDFNKWMKNCVENSLGELEGMIYGVENNTDEETVYFARLGDMGFTMSTPVRDTDDFSYQDDFEFFVNEILKVTGSNRIFQSLGNGYIFGRNSRVTKLKYDFQL